MATSKKKEPAVTEPKKLMKAIKGQPRTYNDGTPYVPGAIVRRPGHEIVKELQDKRVAVLERHKKELAGIDAKIAYHQNRGAVDPVEAENTAKELLAEGMTKEQIDALILKLQKGKKAIEGKTPEEIEAMKQEALAAKQAPPAPAPAAEVPSFLQPVVVTG